VSMSDSVSYALLSTMSHSAPGSVSDSMLGSVLHSAPAPPDNQSDDELEVQGQCPRCLAGRGKKPLFAPADCEELHRPAGD